MGSFITFFLMTNDDDNDYEKRKITYKLLNKLNSCV